MQRRGIYLLPNMLTTAALFFGFYAMIMAMNGRFSAAACMTFIAMLLDGLDGRLARMTNTQSDFGRQYDSLSDLISFGLAPAIIMYQWILQYMGKLGWIVAFVYTTTVALRLARFNVQAVSLDKAFFQGLPSPAAAALISGFIWLGQSRSAGFPFNGPVAILIALSSALLMVSNIRYHSFKQFDLKGRVPLLGIVTVTCVISVIAFDPPLVLFCIALCYAVSGPLLTLAMIQRHRTKRAS